MILAWKQGTIRCECNSLPPDPFVTLVYAVSIQNLLLLTLPLFLRTKQIIGFCLQL